MHHRRLDMDEDQDERNHDMMRLLPCKSLFSLCLHYYGLFTGYIHLFAANATKVICDPQVPYPHIVILGIHLGAVRKSI